MRISDWSSDVCSSDLATCTESVTGLSEAAWLAGEDCDDVALSPLPPQAASSSAGASTSIAYDAARGVDIGFDMENSCRSEEHTSELQSLMRISYAVFCLKKKNNNNKHDIRDTDT